MTRDLFASSYADDLTWVWTQGFRVLLELISAQSDLGIKVETHVKLNVIQRHSGVLRITHAHTTKIKYIRRNCYSRSESLDAESK